jgi:NitT/TauT family transport system substrate-binding protein
VALKLVEVHALAAEALAKNPQVGVEALVKHLGISEAVAKANFERVCCGRKPTFDQQIDPNSQYSLTSKDGGLAKKLFVAGQVLHEVGSIPEAIPMKVIQDAIDPTYVQQYIKLHASSR